MEYFYKPVFLILNRYFPKCLKTNFIFYMITNKSMDEITLFCTRFARKFKLASKQK